MTRNFFFAVMLVVVSAMAAFAQEQAVDRRDLHEIVVNGRIVLAVVPPPPVEGYSPYRYNVGPVVAVSHHMMANQAKLVREAGKASKDRAESLASCVSRLSRVDKDIKRVEAVCTLSINDTMPASIQSTDATNASMLKAFTESAGPAEKKKK